MNSNRSYKSHVPSNLSLPQYLQDRSAFEVLGHFLGIPFVNYPHRLKEAVVVCLDAEWWMKEPTLSTELGIAELMEMDLTPTIHAKNILSSI
jgi:hypothetical protein